MRFSCVKGCAACCEVKGYVYLTEENILAAASYLGMPAADFEAAYVYRTRHTRRLRKPRDGRQCFFLENKRCQIHPAKPTQCRLFPFWPELVAEPKAWRRTAKFCPGIGTGRLVQIGTALERAEEMRRAYPDHYENAE
ncbi:MAG: YkgJ family cysteine cluster protein [Bryobacter sp.]|nr:YkgJ family cysteine cluster protein [Bryobacter sp.]